MGIIKDFNEYENLHDLCENKSLKELSAHPNLKDLVIIQEGIVGDYIGGLKDKVLNSISAHIPGGAIKKINALLAQYDEQYYKPKVKEEIEILRKRFEAISKGKKDIEKKNIFDDPHNRMIIEAWARRIEANKKKWEAKEKELSIAKRGLDSKYKDNPRISKYAELAFAKLEFKRYKEVEEEYKKLLSDEEERKFQEEVNTISSEVQTKEKEAQSAEPGKTEGDGPDVKDVKAGEVWQTKGGKDITIDMNLEDSIAAKREGIKAGKNIEEYKKKGFIATDADGKEIVIPVSELVGRKKAAPMTPEKMADLENEISKLGDSIKKMQGEEKEDTPEYNKTAAKYWKLKIQHAEEKKEEGWEEKKTEYEKNLEKYSEEEKSSGDRSTEISKAIEKKKEEKEKTPKGTPERRALYVEELRLRIDKAKLEKRDDQIEDFERKIKEIESGESQQSPEEEKKEEYEPGDKVRYTRNSGEENKATIVSIDDKYATLKGKNNNDFQVKRSRIIGKVKDGKIKSKK